MENNSSFRSKVEVVAETTPSGVKNPGVSTEAKAELPFKDYEKENPHPFTVDYFQLGDNWTDNVGGFSKEVSLIETYIEDQIDKGELPNNINAVKEAMKKMEKFTNLDKYERPIVKIETLAAYVKFLMQVDNIKFNQNRYAYK